MESEESPALSEPQHKKGETNMRLDAIIERRMRQMIMDLESSGKGTQEEILASVVKYAEKKGTKTEEPQPAQQPAPEAQAPEMGMPAGGMSGTPPMNLPPPTA
jgi:pyruvate/2-oxoglutarate dehydrogenase complex dihydrolipoamide acyltransferase (E2) component